MLPSNRLALKEWAVVVAALIEGRQIFLLRKGGIADAERAFRVEQPEFSLYPTFLHQDKQFIRPELYPTFDQIVMRAEAFGQARIESYALVDEVIRVADLAALHRLETYHIWTPAYVNLRYEYRPDSPLYLLLLRVNRLPQPVAFEETQTYRGCKSWVTLDFAIDTAGATPVMTDAEFKDQCHAIRETLHA